MHGEGQVGLALRRQHTRGGKTLVIDEDRVGVSLPPDAVRGIGDDGVEWLVIPVLRVLERVAELDVELVKPHAMQEHVDAAEVVGRGVDLLTEERRTVVAQHLLELEQQRARAAGRVVGLPDFRLVTDGNLRQQAAHLLGREKLAAALPRIAGIHRHQILVGVAKGVVDRLVEGTAEVEVGDGIENFHQLLVALCHGVAKFRTVCVDIREEALDVLLRVVAVGRVLDMAEDVAERDVEVLVLRRPLLHIAEEL